MYWHTLRLGRLWKHKLTYTTFSWPLKFLISEIMYVSVMKYWRMKLGYNFKAILQLCSRFPRLCIEAWLEDTSFFLNQLPSFHVQIVLGLGQTSNFAWDELNSNFGRPKLS